MPSASFRALWQHLRRFSLLVRRGQRQQRIGVLRLLVRRFILVTQGPSPPPTPNECADMVAAWGRKGLWLPSKIPIWMSDVEAVPFDPVVVQQISISDMLFRTEIQQRAETFGPEQVVTPLLVQHLDHLVGRALHFAPASILSVLPRQQSAAMQGAQITSVRIMDLATQFWAVGLHIVGIQKTRSNVAYPFDVMDYAVFFAPAMGAGQGGLELWVWKPIIQERTHCFVLVAEHRRLLVRVHTRLGSLTVFVGHAIDISTYGPAKVKQWWQETDTMIREFAPRKVPMIWLLNANATLGTHTTSVVGSRDAGQEDLPGTAFHEVLLKCDCVFPAHIYF